MNNKLTAWDVLKRDWILVLVVVFLGAFMLGRASVEPEVQLVDIESKYCFYAEYASADDFNATQRPQNVFISFFQGKVRVFAKCDSIYFYENQEN